MRQRAQWWWFVVCGIALVAFVGTSQYRLEASLWASSADYSSFGRVWDESHPFFSPATVSSNETTKSAVDASEMMGMATEVVARPSPSALAEVNLTISSSQEIENSFQPSNNRMGQSQMDELLDTASNLSDSPNDNTTPTRKNHSTISATTTTTTFTSRNDTTTEPTLAYDNNDNNTRHQSLCLNQDFHPRHDKALFSLVIPSNPNYVDSGRVLAFTSRYYNSDNNNNSSDNLLFDMVLLELKEKPLQPDEWLLLHQAGWETRCIIDGLPPSKPGANKRFVDQFAKLRLFGILEYKRIAYLDSDCMVLGNLDHLFQLELQNGTRMGYHSGNLGVFVLDPSQGQYEELLELQRNTSLEYDPSIAEQSFFNLIYKGQITEIGEDYNGNMRTYKRTHRVPRKALGANDESSAKNDTKPAVTLRVLHFVIKKPWSERCVEDIEYCYQWLAIRDALNDNENRTNTIQLPLNVTVPPVNESATTSRAKRSRNGRRRRLQLSPSNEQNFKLYW